MRLNRSWEIPLLCGLVCAVLTLPMQRKRQNKITLSAAFLDKYNFPTCRLNQEKIISLTVSPALLYCCYVAVYFNLSNHTFFFLSFCIFSTNGQACGEFGEYAIILCSHNLLITMKRKENVLYLFTNSKSGFAADKAHSNLIYSHVFIV